MNTYTVIYSRLMAGGKRLRLQNKDMSQKDLHWYLSENAINCKYNYLIESVELNKIPEENLYYQYQSENEF